MRNPGPASDPGPSQSAAGAGGRFLPSDDLLERPRYRLEHLVFRAAQAAATSLPLESVSPTSGSAWRVIAPRLHRQERALSNLKLAFPSFRSSASGSRPACGRTSAAPSANRSTSRISWLRSASASSPWSSSTRSSAGALCGLWAASRQLGTRRLREQAHGAGSPASTSACESAGHEETRELRAFLYDGGLCRTPVTGARHEGGEERRLSGFPRRPSRRQWRGRSVLRDAGAFDRFPRSPRCVPGLPLYAGAAFREPNVRFVIRAARVEVPDTDDQGRCGRRDRRAPRAVRGLHPPGAGQWMWAHRKWD